MRKITKEYDKLTKQRQNIIKEIKQLEENEAVKRYFELKTQNEDLYDKQLKLLEGILKTKWSSCKHILVTSKIDYDKYEGRTYESRGCIKCGLCSNILDSDGKFLSAYGKIMYNYLRKKHLSGIETDIICDLDLARAIYSKINQNYPNIEDETVIYYLQASLHDIRNIEVNEDRQVSRARRLSLDTKFKKWNVRDVQND